MVAEFTEQERTDAARLIDLAFAEDFSGIGDVTSRAVIPAGHEGAVSITAREEGIVAGLPVVAMVFERLPESIEGRVVVEPHAADGDSVSNGSVIARITGNTTALLAGERTALNLLSHLSGVASLAERYVWATNGLGVSILDTRKTLPGYRALQKYAVRCGGGINHRRGLFDAAMLKDNHLAAWQSEHPRASLSDCVSQARANLRECPLQVEVDSLSQLETVLAAGPDLILLDNMSPKQLAQSVALRDQLAPDVLLEASGGVTLDTVREIAQSGVDRISVGALTHSVKAIDFGFDWPV